MRSRFHRFALASLLIFAVGTIGCGGQQEAVNEAAEAEHAWLAETQENLKTMREELAALRARAEAEAAEVADAVTGDADEGEPGDEAGEAEPSLAEQIKEAEEALFAASDEFNQKIASFFNEVEPLLEGDPPSERQAAVLRMKSTEDMVIAAEYIERGGDYRRAIRIYEDALALDPENEELKAALARAKDMRYMKEERLAGIKKGMTQAEVRELLGPVNLRNIREYPERDVVAWFYPVDDSGKASAVWFRKKGGEHQVYKTEFEQIKGREGAAEED